MPTPQSAPKKTRDFEKTRKHILDVAFWEVFTHGFQGVSVDNIVAKTKLTKGAFFHHFPRKLDLGYALVDEVIREMSLDRWVRPLAAFENPLEGVLHQMDVLIGGSPEKILKFGCPLNNLAQEMAPVDTGFRKRIRAALNEWIDETALYIELAQDKGILKRHLDAREIAQFIVMAHEGFYGMIKGTGDKRVYQSLIKSLGCYFHSLEVN